MFVSTVIGPVPYHLGAQTQAADTSRGPESRGPESPSDVPGDDAKAENRPVQSRDKARAQRPGESEAATKPNGEALSEAELRQIGQMKVIDQEVRRHELAHQIAGGAYTGGASYTYERGPDGNRYVVAGEVPIDYGPVQGDPQATIAKMQQVISAALAPADPSPKDHQVAARARGFMMAAQLEMAQQQTSMSRAHDDDTASNEASPENTDASPGNTDAATPPRTRDTPGTRGSVDTALSQYDIIARAANSGAREALQSLA